MSNCGGPVCKCDETDCPKSKEQPPHGPAHCIHWYDNEGCCWCGDPPCPFADAEQDVAPASHRERESPKGAGGDS